MDTIITSRLPSITLELDPPQPSRGWERTREVFAACTFPIILGLFVAFCFSVFGWASMNAWLITLLVVVMFFFILGMFGMTLENLARSTQRRFKRWLDSGVRRAVNNADYDLRNTTYLVTSIRQTDKYYVIDAENCDADEPPLVVQVQRSDLELFSDDDNFGDESEVFMWFQSTNWANLVCPDDRDELIANLAKGMYQKVRVTVNPRVRIQFPNFEALTAVVEYIH